MLSSEIFFFTILNSSSFFPVSSSPFLLPASNCFFKYLEKKMLPKLDQSPILPTFRATWWFASSNLLKAKILSKVSFLRLMSILTYN